MCSNFAESRSDLKSSLFWQTDLYFSPARSPSLDARDVLGVSTCIPASTHEKHMSTPVPCSLTFYVCINDLAYIL